MQTYGFFALVPLIALASPALADGDAAAGKVLFAKCTACHSLDTPVNKIGPHLTGIVGRKGASVADYTKYSEAMKKAASGGLVWDEATLTTYLAAPKKIIPGTRMIFTGFKKPDDIANLIAYLKTAPAK
ncbi:c-type cytochrome [Pararhizobium sp.]|uniref:c-type cytochrome n=1 Tax=Pararhizobium sp. TaxID=1977563 RepID=UPI00271DBEC5|nr:cytochrome c family protein [Pararhizobium sp.]MDO9418204.1 cytochrome c family protein [Pararhizobium sp.]